MARLRKRRQVKKALRQGTSPTAVGKTIEPKPEERVDSAGGGEKLDGGVIKVLPVDIPDYYKTLQRDI